MNDKNLSIKIKKATPYSHKEFVPNKGNVTIKGPDKVEYIVISVPIANKIKNANGTYTVLQTKDFSNGIIEDCAAIMRQLELDATYEIVSGHLFYTFEGLHVLGDKYDYMGIENKETQNTIKFETQMEPIGIIARIKKLLRLEF